MNVLEQKLYIEKLDQKKNRTATFYARKMDFERINKERKLIGNIGEELVYIDQIEFVKKHIPEYLKSVRHVSKIEGDGAYKRRIMDMGITKGVELYIRKVAPLGDPVEITVRGYELSVRKNDAQCVEVE